MATAQLTYDSKKELFAKNVVSQYDLSTAENTLLTAKAQLAQAEAQRVNAANNLSYTVVKAPSNGTVGQLPYRVGSLVSASIPQPLTTVSDNSEMYVYFSMSGNGVIDPSTGSTQLRAVFPNTNGLLHSGAPGNLILPISYTDCIVVPQVATFELQDKVYVYKIVDGKASSVMIDVEKINNGREYIVKSGLVPGDVIVAEGVGLLREGTPIVAKTQGATPQAAPAAAAQTETEKEE